MYLDGYKRWWENINLGKKVLEQIFVMQRFVGERSI